MLGRFTSRWAIASVLACFFIYVGLQGAWSGSRSSRFGRSLTRIIGFSSSEKPLTTTSEKLDPSRIVDAHGESLPGVSSHDLAAVDPPDHVKSAGVPPKLASTIDLTVPRNFTRAVVIPHTRNEDIAWAYSAPLRKDPFTYIIPYAVDVPHSRYTVPENKGHEAMAYLTYIIDHYSNTTGWGGEGLPDISIFVHAHQRAWHYNELLDSDMITMLAHLRPQPIVRDGYVNLRCHLPDDGCEHLHPGADIPFDAQKPEQTWIREAWEKLFPGDAVPEVLGAPCCSQFALSRDAIRAIPLERYKRLRQWILDTEYEDSVSGRVFEFVWHYLFTAKPQLCPVEHVCYCENYGVCFEGSDGGKGAFLGWEERYSQWVVLATELRGIMDQEKEKPDSTDKARAELLHDQLQELREALDVVKERAWLLGGNADFRDAALLLSANATSDDAGKRPPGWATKLSEKKGKADRRVA